MRLFKTTLIIGLVLGTTFNLTGQEHSIIRPLNIGDTVPDIVFKIINYHKPSVKISDFRGQLLILDFWSTWCSVCIAQFPNVVKINDQFRGKAVIIPVGFQRMAWDNIEKFYEDRKKSGRPIALPSIVQDEKIDSLLRQLFPFSGVPHEVWIDQQGVLRAITGHEAVTKENISNALDKRVFKLRFKRIQPGFDPTKPLLVANNGGVSSGFSIRSMITKYNDSITSGQYKGIDSNFTRLFYSNQPLGLLYKHAYAQFYSFGRSQNIFSNYGNKSILIEGDSVQHLSKYFYGPGHIDSLKENTLFCYDLMLPRRFSLLQASKIMIQDLDRYFNLVSYVENREVSCLALTVKDSSRLNYIKLHSHVYTTEYSEDYRFLSIQYGVISTLVGHLNIFDIPIVLDETNYKENFDMLFNFTDPTNVEKINIELNKIGLFLKPVKRNLSFLIIKKMGEY